MPRDEHEGTDREQKEHNTISSRSMDNNSTIGTPPRVSALHDYGGYVCLDHTTFLNQGLKAQLTEAGVLLVYFEVPFRNHSRGTLGIMVFLLRTTSRASPGRKPFHTHGLKMRWETHSMLTWRRTAGQATQVYNVETLEMTKEECDLSVLSTIPIFSQSCTCTSLTIGEKENFNSKRPAYYPIDTVLYLYVFDNWREGKLPIEAINFEMRQWWQGVQTNFANTADLGRCGIRKRKLNNFDEILDHMIHNNVVTIEGVFLNEKLEELEPTMGMSEKRAEAEERSQIKAKKPSSLNASNLGFLAATTPYAIVATPHLEDLRSGVEQYKASEEAFATVKEAAAHLRAEQGHIPETTRKQVEMGSGNTTLL
eukprot:2455402-Amphidinium_carterae.2